MAEYRVVWEIDVEADGDHAAARAAVEIMKQPYAASIVHVFDVRQMHGGKCVRAVRVDLDTLDGKAVD